MVFGFLCAISCSSQEDFKDINTQEKTILKEFEKLGELSNLKMAKKREPGQKMVLCITFIDKKDKTPVKDQMVLLYQTAKDGNYHPKYASDESTARIKAIGITDNKGRLFIQTILPGSYATSGDNRHIHTKVFGAKPEAYDLHFKQYTNGRMKRFIESRDQFFLIDLKRLNKKKLIGFVSIEVKNPKKPTNNERN